MNKFINQLEKMEACDEAIDWIKEKGIDSVEEFWKVSDRGDWMLWIVKYKYPGIRIDTRILQDITLEFAIMSIPYTTYKKQICIDCIYAIYQYLDGWIDLDELKKYRHDTVDDAVYAAYYAAYAAAYAVTSTYVATYVALAVHYAATDAVTYYAAIDYATVATNASVRQKMYKLQADLIRQYVPTLEIE